MHTPGDLLKAYDERFRQRFGFPAPIVGGKDAKIAKGLLARYDAADLARWLDAFFATDDPFICASTYGLGVFQSVLGKLIAADTKARQTDAEREQREAEEREFQARRKARIDAESQVYEFQRRRA